MVTIPYLMRHLASNCAARLVRNLGIDLAAPIKPEAGKQSRQKHTNSLNILKCKGLSLIDRTDWIFAYLRLAAGFCYPPAASALLCTVPGAEGN